MPPTATPALFRYRRLPGRTPVLRLVSNASSRLWLGDDHLLQVQAGYVSEKYQRFAYGDIQALLLRETARGLVTNDIFGAIAVLCGLASWFTSRTDVETRWGFAGAAAFWLLLLIINLLRGKTCRCQLQTAVGPHLLPSLSRVRPARKAFELIAEKVASTQA